MRPPAPRLRLATMPNPIESLRAEHRAVRIALAVLCRMADQVGAGLPFPGADCAQVLRFLREFADGVHARKEADHVLAALAVYGDNKAAELAGRLLGEQETARSLLHALVLFLEPVGELTAAERTGFREAAHAYSARMLRTMGQEERDLFPAIERCVPADDRLGWNAAFAAIDGERGDLARWRSALNVLAQRWN